jgi:predicted dehydrogenase
MPSKDGKVRVGIIGCGGIANGAHLPGYALLPNVKLVAACDIIPDRAKKTAEDYSMDYTFTDFHKMLEMDELDAVSVCTPNNVHAPASIAALQAGKHVICEKPMAKTSEEGRAMVEAGRLARSKGLKFTIGYNSRFATDSQTLKSMVEAGELGRIYSAKAVAVRRRGVPSWGSFLSMEKQGGGPLIDIGTHALDLTLWLIGQDAGRPTFALGSTYNPIGRSGAVNEWGPWDPKTFEVEDAAFGFVTFDNGLSISIEATWALNVEHDHFDSELYGTKAGAQLHPLRVYSEAHGRLLNITPVAKSDRKETHALEIEHFVDCIITGQEPLVKPEEALVVTEILEAIYKSAASGAPTRF